MPQDGNNSLQPNDSTHDIEMIDEDISVITPKIRPPVQDQDREDCNEASTSTVGNNTTGTIELLVNFNNKMHEIKMHSVATVSKYSMVSFLL